MWLHHGKRLFGFISVYCIDFLWLYLAQLIFVKKKPISATNMTFIGISVHLVKKAALAVVLYWQKINLYSEGLAILILSPMYTTIWY